MFGQILELKITIHTSIKSICYVTEFVRQNASNSFVSKSFFLLVDFENCFLSFCEIQ